VRIATVELPTPWWRAGGEGQPAKKKFFTAKKNLTLPIFVCFATVEFPKPCSTGVDGKGQLQKILIFFTLRFFFQKSARS
jgi:hypothetical protein